MWLSTPELADELRPDNCGVIFETLGAHKVVIALTSPDNPDAWQKSPVMGFIESMLRMGISVIASDGKDKNFILPEGKTVEETWLAVNEAWKEMGR